MGFSLDELAAQVGGAVRGDGSCQIDRVATLQHAAAGSITFLVNPKYRKHLAGTRASAVILAPQDAEACPVAALVSGNPYLAYAATIAAGLDGIKNKIEPPDIFQGDVYTATGLPKIPGTLRDATDELEKSSMFRQAFGNEVVDHYLHFFRTEQRKYNEAVTNWERERYFERA